MQLVEPMLCLPVARLPEGPDWAYELKFDGYCAIGSKSAGQVRLLSRNGKDFTQRYASIVRALEALPDETVIDGEIVAFDSAGRPSFNALQNSPNAAVALHFYAFDLITFGGRDQKKLPLHKRRALLRDDVSPLFPGVVRYSETLEAPLDDLIEAVRTQGFEGIVAKRRDSVYEPGKRSGAWQKMRVHRRSDLVIGGYTLGGSYFDALLVGRYEGRRLMYVAKVRNGFTPPARAAAFERFRWLETERCPFTNLPESHPGRWGEGLTAEEMKNCRWLAPRLIATIEYLEWTAANHLRHARFGSLKAVKNGAGRE